MFDLKWLILFCPSRTGHENILIHVSETAYNFNVIFIFTAIIKRIQVLAGKANSYVSADLLNKYL